MLQEVFSFIPFHLSIRLIGYFLFFPFMVFWIRSVLYATRDISHRTDNVLYQIFMIIMVAFGTPLIGFPLYFIFRPYRSLDDKFWRDSLQTQAIRCPFCGAMNYKDNNYCVYCGECLKVECKECKKKYYIGYDYCPYCGAPNIENIDE